MLGILNLMLFFLIGTKSYTLKTNFVLLFPEFKNFDDFFLFLSVSTSIILILYWIFQQKISSSTKLKTMLFFILVIIASSASLTSFSQYVFTRDKYFDAGDLFHYYLGPKYLIELGYEDLYLAAAIAQKENRDPLPKFMRDLTTNRIGRLHSFLNPAVEERIKNRFISKRWESFKEDVQTFSHWHGPNGWQRRFIDHGYNGSPGWNYFADLIVQNIPINNVNLTWISLLNMLAIIIMFIVVIQTFDWLFGLLFTILFCVNYPDRYVLGGAMLRYIWISSLIIGLCLMNKKNGNNLAY